MNSIYTACKQIPYNVNFFEEIKRLLKDFDVFR